MGDFNVVGGGKRSERLRKQKALTSPSGSGKRATGAGKNLKDSEKVSEKASGKE